MERQNKAYYWHLLLDILKKKVSSFLFKMMVFSWKFWVWFEKTLKHISKIPYLVLLTPFTFLYLCEVKISQFSNDRYKKDYIHMHDPAHTEKLNG